MFDRIEVIPITGKNFTMHRSSYIDRHMINFMPIYYILFTLYNIVNTLTYTGFSNLPWLHLNTIYVVIRILIFICMTIYLLSIRLTVSRYLLCIFIISSVIASTLISGNWNILLLLLFVLCGKRARINILAYCVLWSNIVVILLTAFCYSRGIISAPVMMSGRGTVRNTFGFSHPNSLGMSILAACCAYAVLRFRRFKWYDIAIYSVSFYICNTLVYSRTAAIVVLIIGLLSLLVSIGHSKVFDALYMMFGCLVFVVGVVSSVWMMIYYDSSVQWMSQFNTFMSARPELSNYYYETYSVHLFGFDFSTMQEAYREYSSFICDNAYAHVLLQSGIIVFLILIFGYGYILFISMLHSRLTPCVFGLIIYSIVALSESSGLFICSNSCLVALAAPLLGLDVDKYLSCGSMLN